MHTYEEIKLVISVIMMIIAILTYIDTKGTKK